LQLKGGVMRDGASVVHWHGGAVARCGDLTRVGLG
jgi:hypothetical protein